MLMNYSTLQLGILFTENEQRALSSWLSDGRIQRTSPVSSGIWKQLCTYDITQGLSPTNSFQNVENKQNEWLDENLSRYGVVKNWILRFVGDALSRPLPYDLSVFLPNIVVPVVDNVFIEAEGNNHKENYIYTT